MSTGSSTKWVKVPACSSLLNDPDATKIDNKEDDAALVDSFFLPGGLFADESNNNHHNESKIANSNHDLQIDSIPHTTTSRSSVHLPQNPWETETSNTITAQMTNSTTGSSARMEYLCIQPLHISLPSTNSNDGHEKHLRYYDDNNFNNITGSINRFNFNGQYRDCEEENITGTKIIETSPFHQKRDVIFSHENPNQGGNIDSVMTDRINDSKRVLLPPPGFQNGPTVIPSVDATYDMNLSQQQCQTVAKEYRNMSSMGFSSTTSTSTGNKYLVQSNDDRGGIVTGENVLVAADNSCDASIPAPNLPNLTTIRTLYTFQQNVSLPSNNTKEIDLEISDLHVTTGSQNDKYDNEENSSYLVRYLKKPLPSENDPDRNREARGALEPLVFPVIIGSKGNPRKSNDYIEDDHCNDDAEADIQEEDTEENSIPSNICVSIGAESNSSSLSTCSEVDNNSELSSHASGNNRHINDDDFKDECVGYDTDQAHVSQIVGVTGNSMCSAVGNDAIADNEQSTSPAPSLNSEGTTRRTPFVNEKFHQGYNDQNNSNFTVKQMITFLRFTVEGCYDLIDHALSAMRRSLLYAMVKTRYERFSRQMRKLSRDFHNIANWLIDVEEVFAVLLIRLLKVGRKYSRDITEVLTITLSFLFQLLKFGLIEAMEEFSGVTSCYLVLYLMPRTCAVLMDYINLPHWTPHTVTWLSIFSLCHQVEAGVLHETSNFSISSFMSKLCTDSSAIPATTSNNGITVELSSARTVSKQISPPPRQQQDELSRAQDKQVCYLLLKILRTILPVLFMVEGFSSEFGTIIGASSTNRLTTAFVLSILRKSILSSPIGWVSWALQILLAAYYSSWIFLDVLILLIGLSSIRLVRFLDAQRTRGKRRYEKSNK